MSDNKMKDFESYLKNEEGRVYRYIIGALFRVQEIILRV